MLDKPVGRPFPGTGACRGARRKRGHVQGWRAGDHRHDALSAPKASVPVETLDAETRPLPEDGTVFCEPLFPVRMRSDQSGKQRLIPDFRRSAGMTPTPPAGRAAARQAATPEGHTVKHCYTRGRPHGPALSRHLSGPAALSARPLPDHVCPAALDDPAICRLLHGRGLERLLPPQSRRRPEGPVGRLRSRHASRLRQRPSARRRRCRHGRRRDRFHPRHAAALRRHPARRDDRVDDDERRGAADHGALHRGGGGTGRCAEGPRRDHPERHPEGVHGPQHLHLSAETLDADRLGHLRLHVEEHAEVQLDLDLRLPHAGGRRDGRPGARLYDRRRDRICPRRRRAPASTSTASRRACPSSGRSA